MSYTRIPSTRPGRIFSPRQAVRVSAPFSPATSPYTYDWYDGLVGANTGADNASPASNTDPVQRLYSQIHASRYMVQGGDSGLRPTLSSLGLLFDGTNDYMSFSNLPDATGGMMLFASVKKVATDNELAAGFWYGSNAGSGNGTHHNYIDGNLYDAFGSTTRKSFAGPTWQNTWRTVCIKSIAGEWTYRIGGSQVYTTGTNSVGWPDDVTNQLVIGCDFSLSGTRVNFANFYLRELVFANPTMPDAERDKFETFLTARATG